MSLKKRLAALEARTPKGRPILLWDSPEFAEENERRRTEAERQGVKVYTLRWEGGSGGEVNSYPMEQARMEGGNDSPDDETT